MIFEPKDAIQQVFHIQISGSAEKFVKETRSNTSNRFRISPINSYCDLNAINDKVVSPWCWFVLKSTGFMSRIVLAFWKKNDFLFPHGSLFCLLESCAFSSSVTCDILGISSFFIIAQNCQRNEQVTWNLSLTFYTSISVLLMCTSGWFKEITSLLKCVTIITYLRNFNGL